MSETVRVRFAPSPTGEPHVGNVRTAIFTWLFARRAGGSFVIRIEDTDQARTVEGAVEQILDSLRWLGLDWDEGPDVGGPYGPYIQSERLPRYREAVEELLADGHAYRCFCSPERLDQARKKKQRLKQPPGYDRACRDLGNAERQKLDKSGTVPVARFAMPRDGTTKLNDLIRGDVSFENALIDDFVILKSDGFPTYHLANVVDDHAMEISHVLRAEEWLPSTPRHVLIYRALGWEPPLFAHLPILLAPDRSKLSKRHGATSVLEYRKMGYLPEAMLNFLTLLGWSLDDHTEIMSRQQLTENFSIERVGKSGSIFNVEKLDWVNGQYIRSASPDRLAGALLEYWKAYPPPEIPDLPGEQQVLGIVPLIQERLKTLADASPLIQFLFKPEAKYDPAELVQKGMDLDRTRAGLEASLTSLEGLPAFDSETIEQALRSLADELGVKAGQLFGSLRIATTGQRVAPPLFQTMEVLGRERTLSSVRGAIARL